MQTLKICAEMISSGVNMPGFLLFVDFISACYEIIYFPLNSHLETCELL